jgi:hypothetical protein
MDARLPTEILFSEPHEISSSGAEILNDSACFLLSLFLRARVSQRIAGIRHQRAIQPQWLYRALFFNS